MKTYKDVMMKASQVLLLHVLKLIISVTTVENIHTLIPTLYFKYDNIALTDEISVI